MPHALSILRSTTFKPNFDQAIAGEGAAVVLWADGHEAVLLRAKDQAWEITRHPRIGDETSPASGFVWRNVRYAQSAKLLAQMSESSPREAWNSAYDGVFEDQQARLRNLLGEARDGRSPACA